MWFEEIDYTRNGMRMGAVLKIIGYRRGFNSYFQASVTLFAVSMGILVVAS